MEEQVRPVRGHLCAALADWLRDAGGCEPDITEDGLVRGCDATHPTPIRFCPMCGDDLSRAVQTEGFDYIMEACLQVGIRLERDGLYDLESAGIGFGSAMEFALYRPKWWARLVEARQQLPAPTNFSAMDAVIEATEAALKERTR